MAQAGQRSGGSAERAHGHSNLKTTLEIYGLEPNVTPQHHAANSGIVKMLLGGLTCTKLYFW
jgi:hypothetical protein